MFSVFLRMLRLYIFKNRKFLHELMHNKALFEFHDKDVKEKTLRTNKLLK